MELPQIQQLLGAVQFRTTQLPMCAPGIMQPNTAVAGDDPRLVSILIDGSGPSAPTFFVIDGGPAKAFQIYNYDGGRPA